MSSESSRYWVALGAFLGLIAVGAAAAAAHLGDGALQSRAVASAVQMQGWHALALVACGIWLPRGGRLVHVAAAAFAAGMLLFCGTIYSGALGGPQVGSLAPLGGTLLMTGWALLGLSALRR